MSAAKNILVTGANGQLGMEFRLLAQKFTSYHFLFAGKEELSIDNPVSIKHYFAEHTIQVCINCAAYTAVDKAEVEREAAMHINATAVGQLANMCKQYNVTFFHFSTDYVFNGMGTAPYKESDPTAPVNYYGQTKLLGEAAAMASNADSVIIRTSWVYSSFGKNFVKTMLRLMSEKEQIAVVADQFGCPTYAGDLAAAVMQIIDAGKIIPGIYHYSNEGIISWHQFALAIKELTYSACTVNAIETSAYPTPAARPHYSALDTSKVKDTYELQINFWRSRLEHCITIIRNN